MSKFKLFQINLKIETIKIQIKFEIKLFGLDLKFELWNLKFKVKTQF